MKDLIKTKRKLLSLILRLENRYTKEYTVKRIDYAQEEIINVLLNYLKALEYHYRDDVEREPGAAKNKKNHKEYNEAMNFFDEIAEQLDDEEPYSDYKLKK